jgi:hypothetical protein
MLGEASPDTRISELYESGKHRRYTLLFSINGGAFAVARLLTGEGAKPCSVAGSLTLQELSIGMAVMTVVMVVDIYAFGHKMQKQLPEAFSLIGKAVLLVLGLLIVLGWALVGLPRSPH